MRKQKQKEIPGGIVKIQIDGQYHTYGRILNQGIAFYDIYTDKDIDLDNIIKRPILFSGIVNNNGVINGKWPIIGVISLENTLSEIKFYDTEVTNRNIFRIHEKGIIRIATKEECIGLDLACVWDPIHIEGILQDHYAKRENVFLKMEDVLENYKLKGLCTPPASSDVR